MIYFKLKSVVFFIMITGLFGFTQITTHENPNLSYPDKVSPVINWVVKSLNAKGIDAKNIMVNLSEKYNSSLVRFDEQNRIGVILDLYTLSPDILNRLSMTGGNVLVSDEDAKIISVYLPLSEIEKVAQMEDVRLMREITTGVLNIGSVTTEGDSIHRAVNIRTDLLIMGGSINVGVISDGCVAWLQSQGTGDLPPTFGPANFTFNNPINPVKIGQGDEGTAMMEIIYDLAPNSNLYFYGALHDAAGSAAHVDAIKRLVREKGCKIIVDDLTWYDQPMFEDGTAATSGTIAAAAKWANDTGVVYISSAGNWADGPGTPVNPINRSHYQALYSDINMGSNIKEPKPLPMGPIPNPPPPPYNLPWDDLHNFSTTAGQFDPALTVVVPPGKTLTVVMEWTDPLLLSQDPWGGSKDDYDLYLYDMALINNLTGWMGAGSQTGVQNPWEKVFWTNYEGYDQIVNIVINHRDTIPKPPPKLLGLYLSGGSMVEYFTPQYSIWGQPGVPEVIAVGAVPQNNITVNESFSSQGNYDVYVPAFVSRPKPDVVAVDGVKVTGVGGFGSPFFGTSASAPHVAGLVALMISYNKSMTPADVHSKFERTSVDLGVGGFDQIFGYGRVDLEQAFYEVDTSVGVYGPYTLMQGIGTPPMFFTSPDGYAVSLLGIVDMVNPFPNGTSKVTVPSGSPYSSAGVPELGCPTIGRWFEFAQSGATEGQYTAYLTAYLDESERGNAGIDTSDLQLIHWNGSYFHAISRNLPPVRVGNTWKFQSVYYNAGLSPFFLGYLFKGVDVEAAGNDSGLAGEPFNVVFTVENTGNGWDTLSVHIYDSKGWTFSPEDSGFAKIDSEAVTISISGIVDPDPPALPYADTLWLVAASVSDPSKKDSAFAVVGVLPNPSIVCGMMDGWNMVSVPRLNDSLWGDAIFPTAVSDVFKFNTSYVVEDTLQNGIGYWVKFDGAQDVEFRGEEIELDTVHLKAGWNMVGTISKAVPVDSVIPLPADMVLSDFYEYTGSYGISDTLAPGIGYWVKSDTAGSLMLTSGPVPVALPRIRLVHSDELPPAPPLFSDKSNKLPVEFNLGQNYPNPFNPSTLIEYQLPTDAFVSLKIYNMLGQELETLTDGLQAAGYKSVVFNAGKYTSGIYLYKLITEKYTEVRKMLYIK